MLLVGIFGLGVALMPADAPRRSDGGVGCQWGRVAAVSTPEFGIITMI